MKTTGIVLIIALIMILSACAPTQPEATATPDPTPVVTEAPPADYIVDGDDVHIVASGAHLADMDIQGDLYIDETVGDGEYTLENIVIHGDLIVQGSGPNSGHMINVQGTRIIIQSTTNPRVVLDMETSFDGVQIASDCIVDSQGGQINNVTIHNEKTAEAVNVLMRGEYPDVSIESTANVTLDGEINMMRVLEKAGLTDIHMIDASKMYFFSTYGQSVTVRGGTLIEAWINAEYCSLPDNVEKLGSETGVAEVKLGDVTYQLPMSPPDEEAPAEDAQPTSSMLLSGYPQATVNGMSINIDVAAYTQGRMYVLVESPKVAAQGTTPTAVRDGNSAGAGTTMPDGQPYIVIYETFAISQILTPQTYTIDLTQYLGNNTGGGDGPPPDAENSQVIFVVVEDTQGNLSPVFTLG